MENTTKKYQIKLNPHITIYPIEEKMYTRDELYELTYNAMIVGLNSKLIEDGLSFTHKKWFEQNVK